VRSGGPILPARRTITRGAIFEKNAPTVTMKRELLRIILAIGFAWLGLLLDVDVDVTRQVPDHHMR
jgi:hypothetical protein